MNTEWTTVRENSKTIRAQFAGQIRRHLGEQYSLITNYIYQGLFGLTSNQLRERYGRKMRDKMGLAELEMICEAEARLASIFQWTNNLDLQTTQVLVAQVTHKIRTEHQ